MNNKLVVRLGNENIVYKEKINILTSGVCKSVLPVSLVHKSDSIIGYYNLDGFKQIASYEELTSNSALLLLENLFLALEDCSQFIIFPEECVINLNTVFVDEHFKTVKILYIPDQNHINIIKKIKYFIYNLSNITTSDGREYLKEIVKYIDGQTLSYEKMRFLISKLRYDVIKQHCF